MKRIVSVSMVKNEADIIESFVRHTLRFVDHMIILDHDSIDQTGDILFKLQQEGLPLIVQHYYAVEYSQAELTTDLMWQAFDQLSADLVLPLDADEFLLPEQKGISCRNLLEHLDEKVVYFFPWVNYALQYPDVDQDRFLLARPCIRQRSPERLCKVAVGREVAQKYHLILYQGNHSVKPTLNKSDDVLQCVLSNLHIAHFPWRGQEQALSKISVGWVNNVSRYSMLTDFASHWKKEFDHVLQGRPVDISLKGTETIPADIVSEGDFPRVCYGQVSQNFALRNLMAASERLAQTYIEREVSQKMKVVSIVMLFYGDQNAWQESFRSAVQQTYPHKEIIVCDFCGEQDFLQNLAAEENVSVKYMGPPLQGGNLFAALEDVCSGQYIQWVFPGDVLSVDKVTLMLTALETQPDISFMLSNSTLAGDLSPAYAEVFFYGDLMPGMKDFTLLSAEDLWKLTLAQGIFPSGGLSGILFRRETMQREQWLQKCSMGNRLLLFSCWGRLLKNGKIGFTGQVLLKKKVDVFDTAGLLWHEIEWFFVLQAYVGQPGGVSSEEYQTALRILLERGQTIHPLLGEPMTDIKLQKEYLALLQRIGVLIHAE